MPEHYQGRHNTAQIVGRRGASLLAAVALSLGVIAGDATALGTVQTPATNTYPAAGSAARTAGVTLATFDATHMRPIISTTAIGSVGGVRMVLAAASAAPPTSSTVTAPAKRGTAPKSSAPKAAEATAPKKVPEGAVGVGRASLGAMAGSPGGGTVPIGLAAARSLAWSRAATNTRISSEYGPRWGRLHAGMDFAGPVGTPIRSVGLGVVTFAGPQGAYGNKIEVTLWDGTEVHYGHLSRINVKVGEQVASDQKIGALGNTGRSTGPHLHLEVRPDGGAPINPRPWLKERSAL